MVGLSILLTVLCFVVQAACPGAGVRARHGRAAAALRVRGRHLPAGVHRQGGASGPQRGPGQDRAAAAAAAGPR